MFSWLLSRSLQLLLPQVSFYFRFLHFFTFNASLILTFLSCSDVLFAQLVNMPLIVALQQRLQLALPIAQLLVPPERI